MSSYRNQVAPTSDPFTLDALRNMVTYIRDDRRIARHLGLDESIVKRARTRLPQSHPMFINYRREALRRVVGAS